MEDMTEEQGLANIDELVTMFMDGKGIADVRAFLVEKHGTNISMMDNVCGYETHCELCLLFEEHPTANTQLCTMLTPCTPDEYTEYEGDDLSPG